MWPLSSHIEFGLFADLAIAVLLGIGFGGVLERAGFGGARKLTAVFYLYDMAVVKVMFTAIVTAMVGLFVLSAAGWMDLGELYIEPTNYAAQILGGLVFGAGFIVGGHCPGTSVVAMASGRKDGMVFALGMFAGVWGYAEFTPGIETWIKAGSRGELTLPTLTGIGMGWWALAFVAFLAFAGWGMGRLEKRFARLRPAQANSF
ncbi:MAG: YeeE/YedE thiosulfate transporter family protein [Rubrivivax sp.]|nr:YeeE/YedE thiosulfate transporter family protein [Rubrivivax sp.]